VAADEFTVAPFESVTESSIEYEPTSVGRQVTEAVPLAQPPGSPTQVSCSPPEPPVTLAVIVTEFPEPTVDGVTVGVETTGRGRTVTVAAPEGRETPPFESVTVTPAATVPGVPKTQDGVAVVVP